MNYVKPKAKVSKTPAKVRKARECGSSVPRRAAGYFALTAEDIAEINMFSAAIAKMNWEAEKKNWAKIVAKSKAESKGKRTA